MTDQTLPGYDEALRAATWCARRNARETARNFGDLLSPDEWAEELVNGEEAAADFGFRRGVEFAMKAAGRDLQ